jgi:hypothetical protein
MNNNEIVQARYETVLAQMKAGIPEPFEIVEARFCCNGCGLSVDHAVTDFSLWKLGPFGTDSDFCPACWS